MTTNKVQAFHFVELTRPTASLTCILHQNDCITFDGSRLTIETIPVNGEEPTVLFTAERLSQLTRHQYSQAAMIVKIYEAGYSQALRLAEALADQA